MRLLVAEGLYFTAALKDMGHEVLTIGNAARGQGLYDIPLTTPIYGRDLRELLAARGFEPDAFVWCDRSDVPFLFGFEHLPCVTVGFSIDSYCHPWHVPFSWGFDLLLCAQKNYLPLFEQERKSARYLWFPLFYNGYDTDKGQPRDIPVSFVGTVGHANNPDRAPFLAGFKRLCPLVATTGAYQDIFARSRIVLNQSAVGEINFRLFEAAACGAAVLTEDCEAGLAELFEPGQEILAPYVRGDFMQAADTALAALADPQRLARIAAQGQARTKREHSVQARCRTMLTAIEELAAQETWQRRLSKSIDAAVGLRTAFAFLSAELPPSDPMRELYALLAQGYGDMPLTQTPGF